MEEIGKLRSEILEQMSVEVHERGIERMDLNRVGAIADIVKDLAETEEKCWKAKWYRNEISEAMEKKYEHVSTEGSRNFDGDLIDKLENEYKHLSKEEKMIMKSKILSKLG